MNDSAVSDAERADQARKKLVKDILELKKMGNQMIENTETVIHKAPVMLGIGVVALIGVTVLVSRRRKPAFPGFRRERSFLAEAARSAALSALGILSGRLTQRLLASATDDRPARA